MVVDREISNWGGRETEAATESCSVLARGVGLCTIETAEPSDSMDGVSLVSRSNCTTRAGNRSLTVLSCILSCSIFRFSSSSFKGVQCCDEVKFHFCETCLLYT